MKHLTLSFLLLTVIALNSISAQPLFEGRLTYVQKTSGGMASESKFVEYYKGDNVVSDMPDIKSKIIYRDDSQELVSIQSMMGTPIVTRKTMEKSSDDTPLLFSDTLVPVNGYSCLRVEYEIETEMMQGKSTVWIDTSFKIPFNYGVFADLQYGLVVKSESELTMKGIRMRTSKELQDLRYGDVDMALFALPDEEKAIVITLDEEGNIVYRECDSLKINEMLTQKEGKYMEKISDEVFDKKVKKGHVLLDFGARWCGPCRLLEPRLENLARQHRKTVSFFKIDIDESPVTANRFGVKVVPTVVLLKDGMEVNRFEGGGLSESEIWKWIEENMRK